MTRHNTRIPAVAQYIKEHGPTLLAQACKACGVFPHGWKADELGRLRDAGIGIKGARPRIAFALDKPEPDAPQSIAMHILDVLSQAGQALTVEQIRAKMPPHQSSTLYINLSALVKQGLIERLSHGTYKH